MVRILSYAARAAPLLALFTSTANAQTATSEAAAAIETLDCYSSGGSLESLGEYTFQTSGYCQKQCVGSNNLVMATTDGSMCLCGDSLPPASAKVDKSKCSEPCDGYDLESCGGNGFFQVYLTGLGDPEGSSSGSSAAVSSDASSTTSAKPSVITKAGQTIIVTAAASTASSSSSSSSSGGGSSKVGIAVGVVVGVIAVAAIVGGSVIFLKRRRNKAIEEEHRRNAAVSSFAGSKSETSSTTDQRLNPRAFNDRRESIGSIADERDFSRRILQVRNPDRESKASNMA